MRDITLNVCQGVGDIFWVYQKFALHFDQINFCITQVPGVSGKLQTRAVDFLKLLPKVGTISSRIVDPKVYDTLAHSYFPMKDIMAKYDAGIKTHDYCCNDRLEKGVRLENMDPEYAIEETVPLVLKEYPLTFEAGKYVTVYVSGTTHQPEIVSNLKLWSVPLWGEFVRMFLERFNLTCPIQLIGASYDKSVAEELMGLLRSRYNYTVDLKIDHEPAEVCHILKHSLCYLGYQSGLNILADNLDVKQVMLYFPYLRPMLYTWCKQKNIDNKWHYAFTFDSTPQQVIDQLQMPVGTPPAPPVPPQPPTSPPQPPKFVRPNKVVRITQQISDARRNRYNHLKRVTKRK